MVNGWVPTSLGDILTQERRPVVLDPEKKYAEIGVYSYGRGIFHKEPRTGFEVGNKDLYEIKQSDFIFQITFAWEGAIALASEAEDGMYGSVRFPTYRVNEDICYPKFLLNYFKTEEGRREIGRISPGSAGRNRVLATKRLPEIFVPLPPLTEQRRIVAHIESLAARVNEAQRLREEADSEAEAILLSAQNQFIGSESKSDWVSLRYYVAEIKNGKSPDCEKRPAKPDEWGVLKVGAVSFGVFDEHQNKALPLSIEPNPEYEVKVGDFLMIRANTKELVGACAIVEKTRPKLLISDKTFRFVFREDNVIDPRYLNHVLKSPVLRFQIERQASGTSPTMKNISKEKVMELKVPRIPLDEQRRIVAYLDGLQAKVNALRELQLKSGEELSALMPSILDKAFKGELMTSKSKLYFAYGSNMKTARMIKRVPSAKPIGIAKYMGKKLVFNKISTDGTGKTNIVDSKDGVVLGVLFEVDEVEIVNLDNVEIGYERQDITVIGSDDKPIDAFTYVSTKTNDALKPHDTYLNYLVEGSEENRLPREYIDILKKIETVPDPRKRR